MLAGLPLHDGGFSMVAGHADSERPSVSRLSLGLRHPVTYAGRGDPMQVVGVVRCETRLMTARGGGDLV
jgi:hypothetical protein